MLTDDIQDCQKNAKKCLQSGKKVRKIANLQDTPPPSGFHDCLILRKVLDHVERTLGLPIRFAGLYDSSLMTNAGILWRRFLP